jgi:RHS repeat-associated protein
MRFQNALALFRMTDMTTSPMACSTFEQANFVMSMDSGYRFGFNSMERETSINTGAYDFGARIYDSRLGRWMSPDKGKIKPSLSLYQYGRNNPIIYIDPDGNDEYLFHADGTWSVTRTDGTDVFLKQETAEGIYRQLKTTENLEDLFADIFGDTDLDFLTAMAMNDELFALDLQSNICSPEDQEIFDNIALNAWAMQAEKAVSWAENILSVGGKVAVKRGFTELFEITAKNGKKNIDDLIKQADETAAAVGKKLSKEISKKRDKVYKLYKVVERKSGEFQKWGHTTKSNVEKRYNRAFNKLYRVIEVASVKAEKILKMERDNIKKNPGPMNKEKWKGKT